MAIAVDGVFDLRRRQGVDFIQRQHAERALEYDISTRIQTNLASSYSLSYMPLQHLARQECFDGDYTTHSERRPTQASAPSARTRYGALPNAHPQYVVKKREPEEWRRSGGGKWEECIGQTLNQLGGRSCVALYDANVNGCWRCTYDLHTPITPPLSKRSSTPIPANVFATRWVRTMSLELPGVIGGRRATAAS